MNVTELVEKARALLAAATPGPWVCMHDGSSAWVDMGDLKRVAWLGDVRAKDANRHDARLMASAPTLLAALCDALEVMARERDDARREVEKESALLAELTADIRRLLVEVERLRPLASAEMQRRAIAKMMNGGEA